MPPRQGPNPVQSVLISLIRLRVHDQSSNKVMSPGQDHNPVHSPPMIELGLEGFLSFFILILTTSLPHRRVKDQDLHTLHNDP